MRHALHEYFHYTRAERDAAIVLFALLVALVLLPFSWKYLLPADRGKWTPPDSWAAIVAAAERQESVPATPPTATPGPYDPNTSSLEELVAAGWPEHMARSLVRYREKGGRFRKTEDLRRLYLMTDEWYRRLAPWCRIEVGQPPATAGLHAPPAVSVRHAPEEAAPAPSFPFDPNILSEDSLVLAGLPPRIARNVVRYREAGGRFRDAASLRKIYGMTDSLFALLEPWIRIGAADEGAPPADRPAQPTEKQIAAPAEPIAIDINQADAEEWMRLKGIGKGYAARILRFREALGGFASVEQVAETRGLPDSVFQAIRPALVASPVLRKLDLNTAEVSALAAHPYISGMQARAIVAWRSQHGPFRQPEDIRRTGLFSDKEVARLLPYLECSPQVR